MRVRTAASWIVKEEIANGLINDVTKLGLENLTPYNNLPLRVLCKSGRLT